MKKLLLLASVAIAFASCSKDEDSPSSSSCQLTSVVDSVVNSLVYEKYEYDGSGKITKAYQTGLADTTSFSYGTNTITVDPDDETPTIYTLNASGNATSSIQVDGNDTTSANYYYNGSSKMDSARLSIKVSGLTSKVFVKHTFDANGRISKRELFINDVIFSTETYEYDATSPTIKYNPYFDAYPGVTYMGKSLSDKYPSKVNGVSTEMGIKTNSAGYINSIDGEIYKYSNCQ